MRIIRNIIACIALSFGAGGASAATFDIAWQGHLGVLDCTGCYWLDVDFGEWDDVTDYDAANWDGSETFDANYGLVGPDMGAGLNNDIALYRFDPNNSGIQNELDHLAYMLDPSLANLAWIQDGGGPGVDGPLDPDSGVWAQQEVSGFTDWAFGAGDCAILKFGDGTTDNYDKAVICFGDDGGTASYTGRGLSHVTSVVPVPAAAFLILSGLGGLALMRRRKKA